MCIMWQVLWLDSDCSQGQVWALDRWLPPSICALPNHHKGAHQAAEEGRSSRGRSEGSEQHGR